MAEAPRRSMFLQPGEEPPRLSTRSRLCSGAALTSCGFLPHIGEGLVRMTLAAQAKASGADRSRE